MTVDAWVDALQTRHRGNLTSAEFLKAVRALSARYVERRAELPARSPIDSAGKRAAFAAFYAPLHFVIAREIARALKPEPSNPEPPNPAPPHPAPRTIFDLGCGTGAASAALALEQDPPSDIIGIDANSWALTEASWNWRQLGLKGRTERGDMVKAIEQHLRRRRELAGATIVAAWSVNELAAPARERLLPVLLDCASLGAGVLVIEPLAGAATPWWSEWEKAFTGADGRTSTWTFSPELPGTLSAISEAAGFRRDRLTARTLSIWRT
jgi:hypothetical protein